MKIDSTYDSYKYHDNFVHGIKFLVENFLSEIIFDIDHIVGWPVDGCEADSKSIFQVAKCDLRFGIVTDLKVNIDWGQIGYTTAVVGPIIHKIERREVATILRVPGYYHWNVIMADGRSNVSFGASSITLEMKSEPIDLDRQYLNDSERNS